MALLHLFQGFVDVDALRHMAGFTREAGIGLLDRAAEVGLLTAHRGGYYSIHPALPWFFRKLFEERDAETRETALRAYVEAMGSLGDYYHNQYEDGNRGVIGVLKAEEPNLLHAWSLARQHGWWDPATSTMQGMRSLYDHTGRPAEWARLVNEVVPDLVDPATDGALPGREDQSGLVTEYRVRLAMEARDWQLAEHLQARCVDWDRGRVRDEDRNSVRSLAVSIEHLGHIRREMERPECVEAYREAFDLEMRIQDRQSAAAVAFNLGHAYMVLPSLRDLDEAERWYRKGLELVLEEDRLGQARCYGQLGSVAYERFGEARAAKKKEAEILRHLNEALRGYRKALEMTPPDAIEQSAVIHNQLGNVYGDAGDLDRALHYWRESIRLKEAADNVYGAAVTRYNVAAALKNAGRFTDARQYAEAALRGYQTYGAGAADRVQKTLDLIAAIAQAATASAD